MGEDQGGKVKKGKKRGKYSCMHPFGSLRSRMQWHLGRCDQRNKKGIVSVGKISLLFGQRPNRVIEFTCFDSKLS